MKLVTKCESCKNEIEVKAFMVSNRIDLSKAKGEEFNLNCPHCHHLNEVYVDEVNAIKNVTLFIIVSVSSFVLALVLSIVLFQYYGIIATASFGIPILLSVSILQYERNKIKEFNGLYYNSKKMKERLKMKENNKF